MTYAVMTYGREGSGFWGDRVDHATLADARADVRRRLGVDKLHPSRMWQPPTDDDDPGEAIEGWNAEPPSSPRADGCGGAVIFRTEPRTEEN